EFSKQCDFDPPYPRATIGGLSVVVAALSWLSLRVQRYWNKKTKLHGGGHSQFLGKSRGMSFPKPHLGLHAGTSTSRHAQAVDRIKRNQVNLKKLLESAARRREQESHWHSGSYWHPSASPSYTRHHPSPTAHRPSYSRTSSPKPTSSSTPSSLSFGAAPTSLHTLAVSSTTISDLTSPDLSTINTSNFSYLDSISFDSSFTSLSRTPLHVTPISEAIPITSFTITTDPGELLSTLSISSAE
ncbi:hypothetical protein DFH28DRAFT_880111, partial [Melampsora americana]